MELTDLQIFSMLVIAISLLGINVLIIQTKKLKKKTKLKFTLFATFMAYGICVYIDTKTYSSVPNMIQQLYV